MSSSTVYLISGANKGIGLGLVTLLISRPNTVVYAGARDLPNAKELNGLAEAHKNLRVVKLTSASEEDNKAAVERIQKEEGRLDVVIANAGVATGMGAIATVTPQDFKTVFEVNALGVVVLFQAVQELLLNSPTGKPQFDVVSSAVGSIGLALPISPAAYGTSKAAANFIIKTLHVEHPTLIAQSFHPGVVLTDMSAPFSGTVPGLKEALLTPEQSAAALLEYIDGAEREKSSGKFWNVSKSRGHWWDIETEEIPW